MLTVDLLRHAPTAWNDAGRMQGRRDVPLGAAGRAQARGWRLPCDVGRDVRLVSSPLVRAIETARLLCHREPEISPALIEMDWGAWEGFSLRELHSRHGDAFVRNAERGLDFRPPGGESPRDVMTRALAWIDAVVRVGAPVVAVTHNGVLRAVLAAATGWDMTGKPPVRLRPGTLQRFAVNDAGSLRLVEGNVPLSADASRPPRPAPSAVPP
ncbi:MAG: histidine phosphatase family protein [Rudaea sp.]